MSDRGWTRLPRSRLSPGPGAGRLTPWLGRMALVLLIGAGAWLAFVALRPLPTPRGSAAPLPPETPEVELPGGSIESRQRSLAALGADNAFAPDRQAWRAPAVEVASDEAQEGEGAEAAAPASAPDRVVTGRADRPAPVEVTAEEDVPNDVKKARENLRLAGLRSTRRGELRAMIRLKDPGGSIDALRDYATGDRFTDEKHPRNEWSVLHIDPERDAVYLRRAGANIELLLFPESGILARAEAEAEAEASAADGPAVERADAAAIAEEMRSEGIDERRIQEVLSLVGEPEPMQDAQQDEAVAQGDAQTQKEEADEKLRELFKLMAEVESRSREKQGGEEDESEPSGSGAEGK